MSTNCALICPPEGGCSDKVPCPTPKRGRKPTLTDEERAERKKACMQRWYQRTKEDRREQNAAYMKGYYDSNRGVILERLRAQRQAKREALKAVMEVSPRAEGPPEGRALLCNVAIAPVLG